MDRNKDSLVVSILKFTSLVIKIILVYIDVCSSFFRPEKKKSIKGQTVLITGSGHGLGREMAMKFSKLGVNLVLVDINAANNEQVKKEIGERHSKTAKVLTYSVDIRKENEVEKLAKSIKQELGDVDILINNAGIVQCLPFLELSSALVERTFEVNTLAHIWTIKHFLPTMIKNKRGHIVAIASIAGLIGNKYLTDYCASKFAVVGLMEALDKEIHDSGANGNIHLMTVCPVSISTGMFKTFTSRFSKILPVLTASDVADSVIDGVLTNKTFVVIPKLTLFFHRLSSIIPAKVNLLVQDYLDYGVKPHTH